LGVNLFFLRHGLAGEHGMTGFADDSLRPLTAKGKRQLRKISVAMDKMDLAIDLILSSPFVRAKQTAEIAAGKLKLKKRLAFADELKPGGDAGKLIQRLVALKPAPSNILLVGHEPDLSELIALLVTGKTDVVFALKKGGLAKLEAEKLRAGKCATLAWLLTPQLIQLIRNR
jgi:phosphohistidine phosphatase